MAAKVLVIDDEEAARYGISRALEAQGYALEEASDGREALDKIAQFGPDVIVSDINMPGMDGLTLLRKVNEGGEPPPVILVTAYGSEAKAVEALRAGAYNYLPKPFEVDELRAIVRNAVNQQRLLRENRRIEAELRQTVDQLKTSMAELVQARKMAALAGLVAGIAHEMNTPLGVMLSASDTIQRASGRITGVLAAQEHTPITEALAQASEQCKRACQRIAGTVADLRRFAELDRADFRRAQVQDGLESAAHLLRHRMGDRIDLVIAGSEIPEIDCRPRDLNQLFLNLLENSVEAIERREGRGEIRIETREEGGRIRIQFTDNGCGIPPEHIEKVFDPGFTSKGVRVGTGLGLAVCYRIAQAHDGRIEVESRPGEGSTFTVSLPVRASA